MGDVDTLVRSPREGLGTFARHEVGVDHIMVETDYPHTDSTFPDTQAVLAEQFDGLPADEVAQMAWQNAARVYRHTPPDVERFVREGPVS